MLLDFRDLYARVEYLRDLDDFRAGQVCAIVANVHRDSKAHPRPFSAADFFPSLKPDTAPAAVADDRVVEWFRAMVELATRNEKEATHG